MIVALIREVLLEDAAVTAVFGEDGARLYPLQLPDAPAYPAAAIYKSSGREEYVLAGRVGMEQARVSIEVETDAGYAALVAAKKAIVDRLSGFRGGRVSGNPCAIDSCKVINDTDLPAPATERAGPRVRRRLVEFMVWHKEL